MAVDDNVIFDMSHKVGEMHGSLNTFIDEQRITNASLKTLIETGSGRIGRLEKSNHIRQGITLCLGAIIGFIAKITGHG